MVYTKFCNGCQILVQNMLSSSEVIIQLTESAGVSAIFECGTFLSNSQEQRNVKIRI